MNLKNIIFDLGGVVLNINYQLTEIAFSKIGLPNFSELYSQAKQNFLFDGFEKGLISPEEFRKELKASFNHTVSDEEIDFAWNSMLLDLPKERIILLENLKSNYRTFLLSNSNIIHYKVYTKNLRKEHQISSLADLFEKEFFSFNLHMRKPDEEIFLHVLNDASIIPAETLFIDDSIQHIETAKKLGIKAYLLEKKESILDLFENGKYIY
ncbi:MAG: HAD family phosphatase [Bacteroidetes bacterium]|nr:HAD family phosphatase [Bacteroidota bacterium]